VGGLDGLRGVKSLLGPQVREDDEGERGLALTEREREREK